MTDVIAASGRSPDIVPAEQSLEKVFGDPFGDGDFSWASIVADDRASRRDAAIARSLAEWGVGRALIPASLGGEWASTPDLVRWLRPLFRRDPSLGCAVVASSLRPAAAAWIAGDAADRSRVAEVLRAGGRIAGGIADVHLAGTAGHEDLRAQKVDGGWSVTGRSAILIDAGGADLVLLSALADDGERVRLLWEPGAHVATDSAHGLERIETAGLRGCPFEVITLSALFVDGQSEVGSRGDGVWALAGSVSESVLSALVVGIVDSAIHLAFRYAQGRRLYQGAIIDLPHARSLMAEARTDLLIADALATTSLRALHSHPADAAPISAASALLVPQLLNDAMRSLSVLFGSTFYGSVEPYDAFEKLVRDLAAMSLVGLGSLESAAVIDRAFRGFSPDSAPRGPDRRIFSADSDLPPLIFDLLGGGDRTARAIVGRFDDAAALAAARSRAPHLVPVITRLADLRDQLANSADAAAADDRLDAAGTHALLLAAGSCIGMWSAAAPDSSAFASEWLASALVRIESRITGRRSALTGEAVDAGVADIAKCVAASCSVAFERSPIFPSHAP